MGCGLYSGLGSGVGYIPPIDEESLISGSGVNVFGISIGTVIGIQGNYQNEVSGGMGWFGLGAMLGSKTTNEVMRNTDRGPFQ